MPKKNPGLRDVCNLQKGLFVVKEVCRRGHLLMGMFANGDVCWQWHLPTGTFANGDHLYTEMLADMDIFSKFAKSENIKSTKLSKCQHVCMAYVHPNVLRTSVFHMPPVFLAADKLLKAEPKKCFWVQGNFGLWGFFFNFGIFFQKTISTLYGCPRSFTHNEPARARKLLMFFYKVICF